MAETTTLPALLDRAAGSRRGLYFVDRRERDTFFSYEEIRSRADGAAGALRALRVLPGDRVAIIAPTSVDFFDAFYGSLRLGAVPVPLYPPLRLGRLDEYHARTAAMIRASGARLVLTTRAVRALLGRTLGQSRPEIGAVLIDGLPRGDACPAPVRPDDLALIQFSSGTAASPKPVRLTHRQILANVEAIRESILSAYPESPDLTHVGASWLPLYHDMGLIGSVLTALMHPSDLVLIPPEIFVARPSVWLRAISRRRATVSAAPNFAYSLCADRVRDEEMEGVDLSSLRLAFNGAEPVTPRALDRFIERFRAFGLREEALTPVYGLAEAALAVTFSEPKERFRRSVFDRHLLVAEGLARRAPEGQTLVSVGKALPGYGVRIVDETGGELPEARLGRVLVRGPSLMEGYHGLPEATADVLRDGWLDTGDTGFVCEGALFLYGRRKDLIIVRGRNYAPQDIEQSLEGVAGLRRGCWAALGVGGQGEEEEELVVLVERSRRDRSVDEAELVLAVRRRITETTGLVAGQVSVLDPGTLPRTSSGKIRRAEAKRQLLTGALSPPKRAGALRVAAESIRSALASWREKAGTHSSER